MPMRCPWRQPFRIRLRPGGSATGRFMKSLAKFDTVRIAFRGWGTCARKFSVSARRQGGHPMRRLRLARLEGGPVEKLDDDAALGTKRLIDDGFELFRLSFGP